jgi:hypothetical protein
MSSGNTLARIVDDSHPRAKVQHDAAIRFQIGESEPPTVWISAVYQKAAR